jgi:mannose-6-phosphate isomerase-like protein (cupin superfamily)
MNTPDNFRQPIVRSINSVAEEEIYSFKRRTVFSPETTVNLHIKFCTVTGEPGAQSQYHTHLGDEIVVTLEGENNNYSGHEEFVLKKYQGVAIPPGTEHRTTVTNIGAWKGISFYCDDCPLIQKGQPISGSEIIRKKINKTPCSSQRKLHIQSVFSPTYKETHFLELFTLSSDMPASVTRFIYKGETVYFAVSGSCSISWETGKVILNPGMATAIPAGFPHGLTVESSDGCRIIGGSCSSCPLIA